MTMPNMRIAVLGWGSLVPYPRELDINKSIGNEGWFDDGPILPIEFARISRGKRLTLVLLDGAETFNTYWAIMNSSNLEKAKENLRIREGKPKMEDIGYIDLKNNLATKKLSQN